MKIVIVEPMKEARITETDKSLAAMQEIVGGLIQVLTIDDGVCIVCNEEGKIDGLELNRGLKDKNGELWEIIAGTFFIVGDDYETGDFISLTDEQAECYRKQFERPEVFMKIGNKIEAFKI